MKSGEESQQKDENSSSVSRYTLPRVAPKCGAQLYQLSTTVHQARLQALGQAAQ